MSASRHQGIHNHSAVASSGQARGKTASAKPYRFGIKITRPKTDSMADKALQIDAMRAKRFVGEVNRNDMKMPLPRVPAVLAYLRWLDKMDAWYKRPGNIQATSARLRETEELYSWNSGFGSPVVLPKIRKHPNPEKYRSKQIERTILDPGYNDAKAGASHPDFADVVWQKRAARHMKSTNAYSKGPPAQGRHHSAEECERRAGKHTKFYIHAMNGFKYWPTEKYNPPVHHTKYSFGTQFNPGRAGVVTDRIYTQPRSNKHYWTDFQLRQNPIGSGNSVTGRVLSN